MTDIQTEKTIALTEHYERFRCDHSCGSEIRKRIVGKGGIHFVYQCNRCGVATSNPIARHKAININGGAEPKPFNRELLDKWNQDREVGADTITGHYENVEDFKRNEFNIWYAEYLNSEEWGHKKELIFSRANNYCEGCGEAEAQVVHHLSYRNVGAEFLFQLVALFHPCHDRYHKDEV